MRSTSLSEFRTSFPFRTQFADTQFGRVAYFDEGSGDALVFVHGLGGDFTHFEHVAPAFLATHRVIGIDMPGCGQSAKPPTRHTIAQYASTVLSLLGTLGVTKATLVGHSAGGQVCAAAAMRGSSIVERLVLINSSGLRGYPAPLHGLASLVFQPRVLSAVLAPASTHILDYVLHERNEYTEKFRNDSLNRPREPVLRALVKVFHDLIPDLLQPTVASNARRLDLPTLVLWGAQDHLVPLVSVERVVASLPQGTLQVIRQCGHMPIIEQPKITIDAIQRFLRDGVRQPQRNVA